MGAPAFGQRAALGRLVGLWPVCGLVVGLRPECLCADTSLCLTLCLSLSLSQTEREKVMQQEQQHYRLKMACAWEWWWWEWWGGVGWVFFYEGPEGMWWWVEWEGSEWWWEEEGPWRRERDGCCRVL